MKKRVIIVALFLVLGITACGQDKSNASDISSELTDNTLNNSESQLEQEKEDSVLRIKIPDIKGMSLPEGEAALKDAGFTNVKNDTDRDSAWDEDKWIIDNLNYMVGDEIEPDEELFLNCKKQCQLYLDLKSEGNLFLDRYDMDICIDGENIGSVANGDAFTYLTEILDGIHEIKAYKAEDHSIYASENIEISNDVTFKAEIAHGDDIEFINKEILQEIEGASINVPDVTLMVLNDAVKLLEESGFINVREEPYSDILDRSNWIVINQGLEAGSTEDKNSLFTLECVKLSTFVEEHFSNLSLEELKKELEATGFTAIYRDEATYIELTTDQLSGNEEKNWHVIDVTSKGNKEVLLAIVYRGEIEIPNVEGKKLSEARTLLQELHMSNIVAESDDGSSIWDDNNWDVISQSIESGSKSKADSEIRLICKHIEESNDASPEENSKEESEVTADEIGTTENGRIITVDNDPEYSKLITGHEGMGEDYFKNHLKDTIEFDGNVAYVDNYKDYDTRFTYLIYPGDYSEEHTSSDVVFQFTNVNFNDLHLTEADGLYLGDNIHVKAIITSIGEDDLIVQLDPVAITIR